MNIEEILEARIQKTDFPNESNQLKIIKGYNYSYYHKCLECCPPR